MAIKTSNRPGGPDLSRVKQFSPGEFRKRRRNDLTPIREREITEETAAEHLPKKRGRPRIDAKLKRKVYSLNLEKTLHDRATDEIGGGNFSRAVTIALTEQLLRIDSKAGSLQRKIRALDKDEDGPWPRD